MTFNSKSAETYGASYRLRCDQRSLHDAAMGQSGGRARRS